MKLLFVTWDGPGTFYHETLFIPLLTRAARNGDEVSYLQFSWGSESREDRVGRVAEAAGAAYALIPVSRGPGLVFLPLALLRGLWHMVRAICTGACDTVMARSTIPGGIALLATRLTRGRAAFIFDADGLPADESVEHGGWPRGGVRYRISRFLERRSVRHSDVVLVRTRHAVEILTERAGVPEGRFVVVPNGKDAAVFHPGTEGTRQATRESLNVPPDAPLLVHVGSAGPQYEPGFTIEVLRQLLDLEPAATLLILTSKMNHGWLRDSASDLHPSSVIIREVDPNDVPGLLAACDVGLAFRTPSFSQRAVAPIKIAEYLLCGLPVACRSGVGDLDTILHPPVGFAVDSTTVADAAEVANWVAQYVVPRRSELRNAARELGLIRFSLDAGAAAYREAFSRLEMH